MPFELGVGRSGLVVGEGCKFCAHWLLNAGKLPSRAYEGPQELRSLIPPSIVSCAAVLPAQLSQRRRDRRQLAITGLPPSGRQCRVSSLLDQARPAFSERPLDRPPLPIVDLHFQMSPSLGVVIGLRENKVSDIARCGLSQRANFLLSWANCVGHPSGWSDPLSGLMQPQEAASSCGPRTANVRSSV